MARRAPRDVWQAFLQASELDAVELAFQELLVLAEATEVRGQGLELFRRLKQRLLPELNFRQKKLFTDLEAQVAKRRQLVEALRGSPMESPSGRVLVCGAGPVGLRAAVELALLGFGVTIVEKRQSFSRANILMLWNRTWSDVLSLGAKVYLPDLPVHARDTGVQFYMGTRELQLVLLKTSLLLGAQVIYGHELLGLLPPEAGCAWQGRLVPFVKTAEAKESSESSEPSEPSAESGASAEPEAAAVLEGLKKAKSEGYTRTHKCNLMEYTEVDAGYVNGDAALELPGEVRVGFDHYIVAEGEWSQTTKRLGFDKMVDRFAQALGLVVNLAYNKDDGRERKLESFKGLSAKVSALGIKYEFMEYLKGETHYVVVCIKKSSLLEWGALREDRAGSRQLLRADNLDVARLKALGRAVATACGIPETAAFYAHNPVQLFDFSSRARCLEAVKLLRSEAGEGVLSSASSRQTATACCPALVMPVGDALLEPFWPQGLGSNRGFHTALNAVWACLVARERGVAEAAQELRFAYRMVLMAGSFAPRDLQPFENWSADAVARFAKEVMGLARDKIRKDGSEDDDLPQRIAALPMTLYG